MYLAFLIATVILLVPTVLPMLRHEIWWVRGFDFPRLQLCCLLLALLLLELLVLGLRDPVSSLPTFLISCGWALCILIFVVENFDLILSRSV
jgi:hypothetical protein